MQRLYWYTSQSPHAIGVPRRVRIGVGVGIGCAMAVERWVWANEISIFSYVQISAFTHVLTRGIRHTHKFHSGMICELYLRVSICGWNMSTDVSALGFKGEVQSRITIISKERVKISLQDWCKNDENRIRNKEVVTFWNFTFFRKTFLDQSLWIFKWVSWWCHRLTICHIYYTWNFENFHFFPDTGKSISMYQNISE